MRVISVMLASIVWSAGCFGDGNARSPLDECNADLIACRKVEVAAWNGADVEDKPSWIVAASDLNEHPVVGRLSEPLGQVVAIQATIISGQSLHLKRYDAAYLLRVAAVNGRALTPPVDFEFALAPGSPARLANGRFQLHRLLRGTDAHKLDSHAVAELETGYVGKSVQLNVSETGGFSGIPKGLPADMPVWQDTAFQFETYLMVLTERAQP